jgi:UDP-N-acetylmuramyl pentapeptide phosphotransferase/UDP-N-acetylglucosamine-1-phosphate transferase
MLEYIYFIAISVVTSLLATFFLYPRLKRVGMVGLDINKPDNPEVAEMGGLAIIAGATAGMLLAIFFQTFTGLSFNLTFIMAALITIQAVAFIGLVDDLVDIPQRIKAFVPLFAAERSARWTTFPSVALPSSYTVRQSGCPKRSRYRDSGVSSLWPGVFFLPGRRLESPRSKADG